MPTLYWTCRWESWELGKSRLTDGWRPILGILRYHLFSRGIFFFFLHSWPTKSLGIPPVLFLLPVRLSVVPAPTTPFLLFYAWLVSGYLTEERRSPLHGLLLFRAQDKRLICKSVHQSGGEGGNLGVQDDSLGCTPVGQPDRPSLCPMHLPPSAIWNRGQSSSQSELVVTMGEDRIAIPRSGAEKPGLHPVESGHPASLSGALSTTVSAVLMSQLVCPVQRVPTHQWPRRPPAEWQEGGRVSVEGGGGEDCGFLTPSQPV